MARKFSHDNVKNLEVAESTTVFGVAADVVRRRIRTFAKRAGRAYRIETGEVSHAVTRLPDPVKEAA